MISYISPIIEVKDGSLQTSWILINWFYSIPDTKKENKRCMKIWYLNYNIILSNVISTGHCVIG